MKQKLVDFYRKSLIFEIADSRFHRNMDIREPHETAMICVTDDSAYIRSDDAGNHLELQQHQENNIQSDNTENHLEQENQREQENNSTFQQLNIDDPWFDRYDQEVINTGQSDEEIRQYLDNVVASLEAIKEALQDRRQDLNSLCMITFMKVIRDTTGFQTQNPEYVFYRELALRATGPSIQVTNDFRSHWRCLYYDGQNIRVYDSIPGRRSLNCFSQAEKEYIQIRFPNVDLSSIVFEKVQDQKDGVSCGLFACAFATTLALGGNPVTITYQKSAMRKHFYKVIEENRLSDFPSQN